MKGRKNIYILKMRGNKRRSLTGKWWNSAKLSLSAG